MTKNGALSNSSINWIFLWRLSIQSHFKPPITEKHENEVCKENQNAKPSQKP